MIRNKSNNLTMFFFAVFLVLFNCNQKKGDSRKSAIKFGKIETISDNLKSKIHSKQFESVTNGKLTKLYVLKNKNGLEATFTNFGQRLVSLMVPDKYGVFDDIVLGFSSLEGYKTSRGNYFGATIGRYGNRIANGEFSIAGETYKLAMNNGKNHLHGGIKGFNNVVWDVRQLNKNEIEFTRISPDKEEGYPGNLSVTVHYTLTNNNALQINYTATTDKPTIVNLTHHSFFNLAGEGNGDVSNHLLMINADFFTPVNQNLIPTGAIVKVKGTPFNFKSLKPIGQDLDADNQQLQYAKGYDQNYVLNKTPKNKQGLVLAAKVMEPNSGRIMEVYTNEPGIQFYEGNFLDGSVIGKSGKAYVYRGAICLETQHFPNSPNQPNFPSTLLRPNKVYLSTCVYKFKINN
jgi:aldose 1-epimerase